MAELPMADGLAPAELLQRLTLYAYGLFGCFPHPAAEPVLRVSGKGPEDLAMDVLTRYLDPADRGVSWQAERGHLLPYLKRVLWNDFLDLKRAALYRHSTAEPVEVDEFTARQESAETRAAWRQDRERILARLRTEPDLAAMFALQMPLDSTGLRGNGYTNQELAARLATTVPEIENRKKRLLSRLLRLWREQSAATTLGGPEGSGGPGGPGGMYVGSR